MKGIVFLLTPESAQERLCGCPFASEYAPAVGQEVKNSCSPQAVAIGCQIPILIRLFQHLGCEICYVPGHFASAALIVYTDIVYSFRRADGGVAAQSCFGKKIVITHLDECRMHVHRQKLIERCMCAGIGHSEERRWWIEVLIRGYDHLRALAGWPGGLSPDSIQIGAGAPSALEPRQSAENE